MTEVAHREYSAARATPLALAECLPLATWRTEAMAAVVKSARAALATQLSRLDRRELLRPIDRHQYLRHQDGIRSRAGRHDAVAPRTAQTHTSDRVDRLDEELIASTTLHRLGPLH